jgi:hypothetical protein
MSVKSRIIAKLFLYNDAIFSFTFGRMTSRETVRTIRSSTNAICIDEQSVSKLVGSQVASHMKRYTKKGPLSQETPGHYRYPPEPHDREGMSNGSYVPKLEQ